MYFSSCSTIASGSLYSIFFKSKYILRLQKIAISDIKYLNLPNLVQTDDIVNLTQDLIDVINRGDYESYIRICDAEMTAIEPESFGNLVIGMPFHKFYFDNGEI